MVSVSNSLAATCDRRPPCGYQCPPHHFSPRPNLTCNQSICRSQLLCRRLPTSAEQPASSFLSPAGSLVISWRQVIARTRRIRPNCGLHGFVVGLRKSQTHSTFGVGYWAFDVCCTLWQNAL